MRAGIRKSRRQHRAQWDWGNGRCRKNADWNRERFRGEGYLFAREHAEPMKIVSMKLGHGDGLQPNFKTPVQRARMTLARELLGFSRSTCLIVRDGSFATLSGHPVLGAKRTFVRSAMSVKCHERNQRRSNDGILRRALPCSFRKNEGNGQSLMSNAWSGREERAEAADWHRYPVRETAELSPRLAVLMRG